MVKIERKNIPWKVSWGSFTGFARCIICLFTKVRRLSMWWSTTHNLLALNTEVFHIKNDCGNTHNYWLLRNYFIWIKKHVTFNLSGASYCHIPLSFNVLKSYKNNLSLSLNSHEQTLRITQIHYLPQYNCIDMDE